MVKSIRLSAFLWILLWTVAPLFPVHNCSSTSRPKNVASTAKTTVSPRTTATAKTKTTERKTTTPPTTTLSPEEIMGKIYSMHGGGSGGSYYRPSYLSSSSTKKKQSSSSSSTSPSSEDIMEQLYQQHALNIALAHTSSSSSSTKKPPQKSSSQTMDKIYEQHSSSSSSNTYSSPSSSSNTYSSPPSSSSGSSSFAMDKIYQSHSASSPTMQHILYQHSIQKPSRTTTKPPRTSAFSVVEPLLKQLTPVGAGLGVILAPLLLLDGFMTFFNNIGRYLNNFATQITRPSGQPQRPLGFFRPFGSQPAASSFLRRQPRFDYIQMPKEEVKEFLEVLLRAIDRYRE